MLNVTEKEIGKPIKGFERHYEVSNFGRISNYRKIMRVYKLNSGYLAIKFTINGKRTSHLIHRLVAEAFIPNPENKSEVNHIDGNKENNHVTNLEWASSTENKQHAISTGLKVYNNPTTGKKLGKGSKYHNVIFDKERNRYIATVRLNGKNYFQKRFKSENDAALHVNWILDILGLDNRPRNIICN